MAEPFDFPADPDLAGFTGHPFVQAADQFLAGSVNPVAQLVVFIEGVVELLDFFLAEKRLLFGPEIDIAEDHAGLVQVLAVAGSQLVEGQRILEAADCRVSLPVFKLVKEVLHLHLRQAAGDKLPVGHLDHVLLAHFRQDVFDVVVKKLVRTEHDHVPALEVAPVAVQEEGDPLQDGTGLARPGRPLDKEQVAGRIPDDLVLLLLDGLDDGLHLDGGLF